MKREIGGRSGQSGGWLTGLAVPLMAMSGTVEPQQLPYPSILHVKPTSGDDLSGMQLYHRAPNTTVVAPGNYWLRDNQDADGNGVLTGVFLGGVDGINLPIVDPITMQLRDPVPPGPFWGEFDPNFPFDPFPRNYSLNPSCDVNFGTDPPPLPAPDCGTDPCPL